MPKLLTKKELIAQIEALPDDIEIISDCNESFGTSPYPGVLVRDDQNKTWNSDKDGHKVVSFEEIEWLNIKGDKVLVL